MQITEYVPSVFMKSYEIKEMSLKFIIMNKLILVLK